MLGNPLYFGVSPCFLGLFHPEAEVPGEDGPTRGLELDPLLLGLPFDVRANLGCC